MKKIILISSFLISIFIINSCQSIKNQKVTSSKMLFKGDVDSLKSYVEHTLLPLSQISNSEDALKLSFLKTRQLYKKIEPLTEYFFPTTAKLLNGPPLDEVELTDNVVEPPSGLQVIEEYLYPFDSSNRKELVREIRKMNRDLLIIQNQWEVLTVNDAHIFDALRLETYRIISLGISGFDVPLAKTSMSEAAIALSAIERYLDLYDDDSQGFMELKILNQKAQKYLLSNQNFDNFNRLDFIAEYVNPISGKILAFQKSINVLPFKELRPLKTDSENLFAEHTFDANFYAPNADSYSSKERIELGKKLFYDPILSKNNSRSCASCHQPDKAFTDGLAKPSILSGNGLVKRNVPTLMNAGLQGKLFYDLRVDNLENQSMDVINNKDEMHGSLKEAVQKLKLDKNYISLFQKAFPTEKEAVKEAKIMNALASYERSLVSLDSRFDKYMRGQKTLLTESEKKGYNLFSGKAKCGICHFTPLFNGTIPPNFTNTESEIIGVPETLKNHRIDPDLGRYTFYKFDVWKYAFKTPTLRNIALTAPYMHNGVYKTLEEVVEFYNKGGGKGLGFMLENQTLPEDKLDLTKQEKQDLVAFMRALTDVKFEKKMDIAKIQGKL
jgi:cytochrome c peroxidase